MYYNYSNIENVIHEPCFKSCNGNDLVCDINRCKKIENASCAATEDCKDGLECIEWKCVPKKDNIEDKYKNNNNYPVVEKKSNKKITWHI